MNVRIFLLPKLIHVLYALCRRDKCYKRTMNEYAVTNNDTAYKTGRDLYFKGETGADRGKTSTKTNALAHIYTQKTYIKYTNSPTNSHIKPRNT